MPWLREHRRKDALAPDAKRSKPMAGLEWSSSPRAKPLPQCQALILVRKDSFSGSSFASALSKNHGSLVVALLHWVCPCDPFCDPGLF